MATDSGAVNEYTDKYGRKFEGPGLEMVDNQVIEEHLRSKNYDLAFTVYRVEERTRDLISDDPNGTSGDDGAATAANTSVSFGESGVKISTATLQPIERAVSIDAHDGGREEKEQEDIKKAEALKAKREAEKKAREQGDRAE